MKLREIAEILNCKLVGNEDVEINGVAEIQNAKEGQITFLSNPKYRKFLKTTRASAIILEKEEEINIPQLICEEPYVAFAKLMQVFFPEKLPEPQISEFAFVSKTAKVGKNCFIGFGVYVGDETVLEDEVYIFPGSYVGNHCHIGKGTVIFPNVVVYDGVKIGKYVRIHSGTVVGSDGFGYAFSKKEGKIYKIPQVGGVVIEDFVEIGANTTIDRGTIGNTVIGEGTKIDNLVQIGHNVKIGKWCFVVSQVGISGSAKIGNYVTLAGKVGVAGHVEVADGVTVTAKAGVTKDIKKSGIYSGFPAKPHNEWKKIEVLISKLPEIYRKFLKRGGQ